MKQLAQRNIRRTLLAAAIGALLPVGAANALDVLGNHFDDSVAGMMAPQIDTTQFTRLEVFGNEFWVPKAGAAGPQRTETIGASGETPMQPRPEYQELNILGNVFMVPKQP